jgi:hypothetical protein
MKKRIVLFAGVLTMLLFPSWAKELAAGPSVLVTVFNENLGMIAEGRSLDLVKGTREVAFPGVPARIDPASVQFRSLTAPGSVSVQEQRFEFDLSGTERLLSRYADRSVLVTTREGEALEGVLLDLHGGDVALRLKDNAIRVIKAGAIDTFLLRGGERKLVETPTLSFLLQTSQPGKHDVRIHYLTKGMGWGSDYVAKVDREGEKMELSGWASIENRSGASFEGARVQLVAGSVHQQTPVPYQAGARLMAKSEAQSSKAAPGFQESPFAEYRFYMLQRAATLADGSVTRLPLFPTTEAKVRQEYSFDGARDRENVHVNLVFQNEISQGLGIPLPAGTVRVYKNAPNGSLVFTGEDRIDHVPEGEKVELFVGSAFDIKGERSVLETRQISKRSREETVQIELRNQKNKAVNVKLIEHFRGNWKFVGDTPPVAKKQADQVEFQVKVPRKGEKKFLYKVLYNW